jgi:hypothetical protein
MESRFSKYKSEGSAMSNQIANINNYIDWNFDSGLNIIEKEINSLRELNARDGERPMFKKKEKQLIALGEMIEQLYETYHYNKDNKEN